MLDFFAYFQGISAARRAAPAGDLASAIANARVDGEYLSDIDTASYYVIIATAGHDTTSSTMRAVRRVDHRLRAGRHRDLAPSRKF